ncbi:outer membrane protein assembly factor BamB family protein [Streptomyces roseolus]|uniref:outer membrane protein assembly factor BamB family protein n=3 Tax=Streptomyces roseolus TaxID=67358 RepID=UPI003634D2B8
MATATKAAGRAGGDGAKKGKAGGGGKNGTANGGARNGGTPGPASRAVRYTVVGGLLLAVLAGVGGITVGILADQGHLPGDSLREVWNTPDDDNRPSDSGNASWASGDAVAAARADGVTGYDARTGARRWRHEPDRGAAVCSVSRTAADGVVLIAQGVPDLPGGAEGGEGCTTVTALDLRHGRELWRTTRVAATDEIQDERDLVAVGGGLAVVRDEDPDRPYSWVGERPGSVRPDRALRALDLRTGKPRWTARVPKGCVPYRAAAAERQVLALLVCDRDDIRLAAFDPADGKHRWTTELDERRRVQPIANASEFLSADPVVVRVDSLDESGSDSFLSFSADGRPQGRIASGGANEDFEGDRPAVAKVAYGRLYLIGSVFQDTVSAFDLRSGRRLWRARLGSGEDALGLGIAEGRVTVPVDLYGSSAEDGLVVLDADTGDERDLRTFPDSVASSAGDLQDVLPGPDGRLILARREGYDRPFTAYEER